MKLVLALLMLSAGAAANAAVIAAYEPLSSTDAGNAVVLDADNYYGAQTFVAGIGGVVGEVSFLLRRNGIQLDGVVVGFHAASGGPPQSPPLGELAFAAPVLQQTAQWYTFDLASLNLTAVAGQTYAVSLRPTVGSFLFQGDFNKYSGGSYYSNEPGMTGRVWINHSTTDVGFRVNTAPPVPLPAAAWLLLSGMGAVAAAARRKRTAS